MNEQKNKETTEKPGNQAETETSGEKNHTGGKQTENSSAVHIEPSEPQNQESETGSQTGDPGRTPGKAEG